jgi:hypothetical protein
MTASETLIWLGASAAMHLIWGIVLGIVVSYGLQIVYDALLYRNFRANRPPEERVA